MGDLVATCISTQSRNRHVGEQLGKGRTIEEIIDEMNMVAEGVKTASVVMELSEQYDVDMPIAEQVYAVLNEGRPAAEAYRGLLGRRSRRRAPRDLLTCSRSGSRARPIRPAPTSCPASAGSTRSNVTHRSWTTLGTVAAPARGVVDPRGLVTASSVDVDQARSGWSLDWWIGADDRWHTPSTDAGVRQRLVDDAPGGRDG